MNKTDNGMQQKFMNMGLWVSSLIDRYAGQLPEELREETKSTVATYFEKEENYLNIQFSMLPGLLQLENSKKCIENLRSLKNKEQRETAIKAAKEKAVLAKCAIDAFLQIPEDELDAIIQKFSLYINLFTDMYIKK